MRLIMLKLKENVNQHPKLNKKALKIPTVSLINQVRLVILLIEEREPKVYIQI